MPQLDIFGGESKPIERVLDRFGHWPITIWKINYRDKDILDVKAEIGDDGQGRGGTEGRTKGYVDHPADYRSEGFRSVFRPDVAANILAFWAPKTGTVYDPFAGGGTRAMMSAGAGLSYMGCEIREDEVGRINAKAERMGFADMVDVRTADATDPPFADGSADFSFTCPPYWQMEKYDGGPSDMSMMGWPDFVVAIREAARHTARIMRPGAFTAWVVGLYRFPGKERRIVPLNHLVAWALDQAGLIYREEVIIEKVGTPALTRVGTFNRGAGLMIRVHEYVLVFAKPYADGREIRPPHVDVTAAMRAQVNGG